MLFESIIEPPSYGSFEFVEEASPAGLFESEFSEVWEVGGGEFEEEVERFAGDDDFIGGDFSGTAAAKVEHALVEVSAEAKSEQEHTEDQEEEEDRE